MGQLRKIIKYNFKKTYCCENYLLAAINVKTKLELSNIINCNMSYIKMYTFEKSLRTIIKVIGNFKISTFFSFSYIIKMWGFLYKQNNVYYAVEHDKMTGWKYIWI